MFILIKRHEDSDSGARNFEVLVPSSYVALSLYVFNAASILLCMELIMLLTFVVVHVMLYIVSLHSSYSARVSWFKGLVRIWHTCLCKCPSEGSGPNGTTQLPW